VYFSQSFLLIETFDNKNLKNNDYGVLEIVFYPLLLYLKIIDNQPLEKLFTPYWI
jgi:hypothetical protein